MAKIDLKILKKRAQKEIKKTKDLKELDQVFRKFLGKKGELSQVLRSLGKLAKVRRIKVGKEANEIKNFIKQKIEQRLKKLSPLGISAKEEKLLDVTVPGKKPSLGHLHPLTQVKKEIEKIFQGLGFSIVEGPEIETEWYNFDALNIPKEHPARDLWDTFWLQNNKKIQNLLLRTHTTPVDVRYMEKNNPPLRIIVPGRCFRHEATDASHDVQFYQVDGLMVGKDISVANFKAVIENFFQEFFKRDLKIRMRPSFFPFTEPSFEIDISCLVCQGKGCSACSQTGWMEMMGAGMLHPNVFKACKLNPKNWQGFAFGVGLDRLAMMKYKIGDIRLFYNGDLRVLEQF